MLDSLENFSRSDLPHCLGEAPLAPLHVDGSLDFVLVPPNGGGTSPVLPRILAPIVLTQVVKVGTQHLV